MDNNKEFPPFKIPKNGEDQLEIGEFDFEFVDDQCIMKVGRYGNDLNTLLTIKTTQIEQATNAGLLKSESELETGVIQLEFKAWQLSDEYSRATGEFTAEKSSNFYHKNLFFNIKGTHPLQFQGRIAEQSRWLGLNGILKSPTNENLCWPINICKNLETNEVDWTYHEFTLEETRYVEPELVNKLRVSETVNSTFPRDILNCKNLNDLTLFGLSEIREIPEEIGDLEKLERLSIIRTPIEQLPDGIFRLPNLQSLHLAYTKLKAIPSDIHLPNLRSIALNHNQLTTLPKSLAQQPLLTSLSLENNPWESLPSEFNRFENIYLSLADKKRLLDHSYKGADGKGVDSLNNTPYFVKSDATLQDKMLKAIKNTMWDEYREVVKEQALRAICLSPTKPDDYSEIGNTRFGGLPDMPMGTFYPTYPNRYDESKPYHYLFYAQLNCKELAPLQDYLPRKGMLYFYVEEEEEFRMKVEYYPSNENLQSAKYLPAMDFNNSFAREPYKPFTPDCAVMIALPQIIDGKQWYELDDEFYERMPESEREGRVNIGGKSFSESLGRKGVYREHNDVYYESMNHSINDSSGGITQGSPNEMAALERKGEPEDWMVLLRMYSHYESGFQFNDAGELYIMIHKSDLAKADFSNVFAYADSS